MMTQNADKKREQVQFLCMDDMVPQDHLLRIIDKAIDWNFIYDLVAEKYSPDNGRPSMDPVMLIKIPFIQYLYAIETACDKNGWILGYTINPGNQHDSRTFKGLYDKIKDIGIETLVADAGYKTPAIAKLLIDDGIKPLLPYKRPMTKDGFFKKYEYVYDEYYDCYICPGNQLLTYRTTNRDGYREYKSCGTVCAQCSYLSQCTESRDHVKTVTRHIWEPYMEICEDIGNEGFIREEKRNHRKTLWKCKGESWFSLYTDVRKNPDGNEGRAYVCVYEFEKVSKDKGKMGTAGGKKTAQNFYFERNSFDKRKMALGYKSQSRFVYSLWRSFKLRHVLCMSTNH